MRRYVVNLTTAAGGGVTGYTPKVNGKIHSIRYVKTDFADGSTFTITDENTGENIWTETGVNASASRYPRAPTHSQVGVASLYAAAGTAVQAPVGIAGSRVKLVISAGGNTKSGTFHVFVD